MNLETITFKNNTLEIIDQQALPNQFRYMTLSNIDDVIRAIKDLHVRGAPAIGIVAGYGLYVHARNMIRQNNRDDQLFFEAAKTLQNSRPTAINLQWAVEQMVDTYRTSAQSTNQQLLEALKEKAIDIHHDDKSRCDRIGAFGSAMLDNGYNVITHCNAGILATGGIGTALAPVYKAAENKKNLHVFVNETRPVGQGARLTYWELLQNGIPATLITDNMAAALMQNKKIDLILVGADRVAKNGDVANKIGTYGLAVLARHHNIPFYVAAPLSTFDMNTESGNDIPIEMRDGREVLQFWNINSKLNYKIYNPAFDITPNHLIAGIITEDGIKFKNST